MPNPINIAIVHCHYEPGGVTGVVQSHVETLRSGGADQTGADQETSIGKIVLLSGKRVSGIREQTLKLADVIQVPELDYDSEIGNVTETDTPSRSSLARTAGFRRAATGHASLVAQQVFETLDTTLRQAGLTPDDTVIHWHNHSLGKNAAAPLVSSHLAMAGWRLLLQIHDFAEDQRPENVAHLIRETGVKRLPTLDAILYPDHPNIALACLTSGDAEVLRRFGIARSRVVTIPNSVRLPATEMTSRETAMKKVAQAFGIDEDCRWVLYPIRGIRRKNLGEFLLLCQLLPRGFVGAITIRPDTTLEAESYDRWRDVATREVPNVVFDAAHHDDVSFADNLSACHCVLSTSVAEGFGMAFLEPWLAGRTVVARNLPGVTSDFAEQGVQQPGLYDAVWIPGTTQWVDERNQEWETARQQAWSMLPEPMLPEPMRPEPMPPESDGVDQDEENEVQSQSQSPSDRIDFARLTPSRQIEVIRRVATDVDFRTRVAKLNAKLLASLSAEPDEDLIESNRRTIASGYCAAVQRAQLTDAYRSLLDRPTMGSELDKTGCDSAVRMLDLVAESHPFYPCRVEDPIET